MTAVTDQETIPHLDRLTPQQRAGIDCVWCTQRLGVHARVAAEVTVLGHRLVLYACPDRCELPHRRPRSGWWPPPGAVSAPPPP